jgi:hypothetical protein
MPHPITTQKINQMTKKEIRVKKMGPKTRRKKKKKRKSSLKGLFQKTNYLLYNWLC